MPFKRVHKCVQEDAEVERVRPWLEGLERCEKIGKMIGRFPRDKMLQSAVSTTLVLQPYPCLCRLAILASSWRSGRGRSTFVQPRRCARMRHRGRLRELHLRRPQLPQLSQCQPLSAMVAADISYGCRGIASLVWPPHGATVCEKPACDLWL